MLFMESKVGICDNSGVTVVKCIKVVGKGNILAGPGCVVVGSVARVKPRRKIKKGDIARVVIVSSRRLQARRVGNYIASMSNAAVLVKRTEVVPYGNRLKGISFLELRKHGLSKILTMSKNVI
jgi:large subunit ribosomal protein L14